MSAATLRASALEVRGLVEALGRDERRPAGQVLVSGTLAEQLARELGAGAAPGAVVVGTEADPGPADVAVHVVAGEVTEEDRGYVQAADRAGVPVVLVQLEPQADRAEPFMLSPFVVECRTGAGFPVGEIASRIAEAVERPAALGARIPALADPVSASLVRRATVRAGLLAALGARAPGTRRTLTLEQARLVARLRALSPEAVRETGISPVLAGTAAAVLGTGFVFRGAARALRGALPEPVANAAVAAAGTWAVGRLVRLLEARLGPS